jgi:hypothetical protein
MKKLLAVFIVSLFATSTSRAQGVVLPLPAEDAQRINAMLGPGVVGNPVPSKPINDAPTYFPLQNKSLTYQVTSGKNTGNTQVLSIARRSRPDGQEAWRFQFSRLLQASSIGRLTAR